MRFSGAYGLAALLLFGVEVLIALFVHDDFVRPYVGDVLVVILLYCLVMTFFALPKWSVLLGVLVFACSLEVAQYFQLVTLLGLQDVKAARIIIGTTYSRSDLAAYAAGTVIAGGVERFRHARRAGWRCRNRWSWQVRLGFHEIEAPMTTTTPAAIPWVHYDEAMAVVRTFDSAMEQFVMRAVAITVQNYAKGVVPSAPFDMLYFVNTLAELFGQKDALVRICAGKDLRWWGDD